MGAGPRKPLNVLDRSYTTLRDGYYLGRNERQDSERCMRVDLEGLEVPVVDSDQSRPERESKFQLTLIAHFNQNLDPGIDAGGKKLGEPGWGHSPGNHQGSRCAESSRLKDLNCLDVEVLLEQRNPHRSPGTGEIFVGPAEPCWFSEDRKSGRASSLVRGDLGFQIEVAVDHTPGR